MVGEAAFTRCMALIDTRPPTAGGDELIPCRLEQGHDGPHEPMDYSAWKTLKLEAFLGSYGVQA